jgi:peptide/nickel transport system substrate-binding protein
VAVDSVAVDSVAVDSVAVDSVAVSVVLLLLFILAMAPVPSRATELVIGTVADPVGLDLHAATDLLTATVAANACEPLVRMTDAQKPPRGLLATSWATRDNRSWTFTLREGVRFQDGRPFDADSVVANLHDLAAEGRFEGRATRIGPHAVTIGLEVPNAALMATLSQPFHGMQSPRQLAEGTRLPTCTGPFRVVSAAEGTVRLARHPGYWGPAARLDGLVFRAFSGEEELVRAVRAGRVDVAIGVNPRHAAEVRADPALRVRSWTGLNLAYLALNHDRPQFRDRRVREALAHAIDRGRLVREVLRGHAEPARNPLPPGLPGYARRTPELILDRRLARRLLAESGVAKELRLLTTPSPRTWMPDPEGVAARIREDLEQVGVKVVTEQASGWSDYLRRVTAGDFDMAVLGWEADTLDANDFLVALLSRAAVGRTNRSRYADERMEALLRQGRRGSDPRERARTYAEVQRLFRREMPWVPLYHVEVFMAHRATVQGLVVDPTGILRCHQAWRER